MRPMPWTGFGAGQCSEWERVLGGGGCAAAKQRNKSRKKKTQESGNTIQNRKVVKQIPGMTRKRTDRLTALQQAYGRSQARSEQTDRRSPEEYLRDKGNVLKWIWWITWRVYHTCKEFYSSTEVFGKERTSDKHKSKQNEQKNNYHSKRGWKSIIQERKYSNDYLTHIEENVYSYHSESTEYYWFFDKMRE